MSKVANLTADQVEEALRNSGYEFNSKIISAECVDEIDEPIPAAVYEVTWDPVKVDLEPVSFCNTIYVSCLDDELFGDI